MTKVARNRGRPCARRPNGAAHAAAGVLALLALAVAAAPAGADEMALADPSLEGGVAAPVPEMPPVPVDTGAGGAVAPLEEAVPVPTDLALEEAEAPESAIDTGGQVAPPADEAPPEALEPPPPEAAEPPPETAEPLRAEPPKEPEGPELQALQQQPVAQVPMNLNVDIRILSPGDDGDVIQEIVAPVGAPDRGGGGASAPALDWDWDWNWTWDCGGPGGSGAGTAGWDWNWQWSGDCGAMLEELVDSASDAAMPGFGLPVPAPPDLEGQLGELIPTAGTPSGDRPPASDATSRNGGAGPGAGAFAPARPVAAMPLAAPAPPAPAAPAATRHEPAASGDGDTSEGGAQQVLLTQPLLAAAASAPPPPGGSSSVLLVILLGTLCLLAPRASEPALMRARRLRSLLRSQRLERPG
jgi:hypothetical protein